MSKQRKIKKEKDLNEILRYLPAKEQKRIKSADLTEEFVDAEIEKAKKAMKLDVSFGLPWLFAYIFCIWKFAYTMPTLLIFGIGLAYFSYAIFTRGTYGMNSKRVKAFEEIKKIKN